MHEIRREGNKETMVWEGCGRYTEWCCKGSVPRGVSPRESVECTVPSLRAQQQRHRARGGMARLGACSGRDEAIRWKCAMAAVIVWCNVGALHGWGWLMIGNWSAAGFTLPCQYQSCIQVRDENTSLQLNTYRCRGEVWWQEQFTYVNTTAQITTQPRYGPQVCIDIMPNTAVDVGVSACNATKTSQQWSFVGTKIQNAATRLFLQVQPVSGFYLTYFAGASLNVSLGPKQPGYISDFTLMDSSVLKSYKPPPPSTINHVRNGLFGMNWNEKLGLEAADMTEICNWKIMADIDLNQQFDRDPYGWNVQLNAGPQHWNRHGQRGAISQLVPTYPNREHSLLFQGSGLGNCGGRVKNVTVSIVPSSVNSTTVSISAGKGWQLQRVDFNATDEFVNLTLSSASDEGTLCGPNITDVKIGLKGAFDELLKRKKGGVLGLSALDGTLILALITMGMLQLGVIVVMRARIRSVARRVPDAALNVVPTRYTFRQMKMFTMNFRDTIGEGGFSVVYRGMAPDGALLAVKRNKRQDKSFHQEVDMLSRVHHRRVVRFLGYCDENNEQILVSEYMENGSLYEMLHSRRSEDCHLLTFEQRLKILRDVALGLEYLHHGASPGIIHRDIKSANVLLDNRLSAKMADFGCFKQGHDNTFSINSPLETTNYRGTFGYMDPTLATSLTVSTKSDVYSFGVLVLELVTGRKAMDVHGVVHESGMWTGSSTDGSEIRTAPSMNSPSALSIVDPLIMEDNTTDVASLQLLVSTAYQCLNPVRDERPSMIEVVRLLGPAEAFEDSSAPSLVVSVSPGGTVYSSTDNSAAASSLVPLVNRSIQEALLTHGR